MYICTYIWVYIIITSSPSVCRESWREIRRATSVKPRPESCVETEAVEWREMRRVAVSASAGAPFNAAPL